MESVGNPIVKVVVTGPESCGKTTLAEAIAKRLQTPYVIETSRMYLESLGREYVQKDLKAIGLLQIKEEYRTKENSDPGFLLCDTDSLTTLIWSIEKYGGIDSELLDAFETEGWGDLYLLCAPDIPWEPDPLRENPYDRDRLFEVYLRELDKRELSYVILKGSPEERLEFALDELSARSII